MFAAISVETCLYMASAQRLHLGRNKVGARSETMPL